jgi:hypothetical protein
MVSIDVLKGCDGGHRAAVSLLRIVQNVNRCPKSGHPPNSSRAQDSSAIPTSQIRPHTEPGNEVRLPYRLLKEGYLTTCKLLVT